MKKLFTLILLPLLIIALIIPATASANGYCPPPPVCPCEGETPGFWKNNLNVWYGYSPDQTLADVFQVTDIPLPWGLGNYTLLEALQFRGGPTDEDMAKLMLRQAVAGLLNAAHPGINYVHDEYELIWAVRGALNIETLNRATLEWYKDFWEAANKCGSPLDAHGRRGNGKGNGNGKK